MSSLVLPILELLWESTTTERNKSLVASSLLAGMMVGQVGGGVLGDAPSVGLVKALALVMALQVVASVAAAFCQSYVSLTACQFILGIGAGGVYPLAAALSAEQQQQQGGQRCASNSSAESLHRVVLAISKQLDLLLVNTLSASPEAGGCGQGSGICFCFALICGSGFVNHKLVDEQGTISNHLPSHVRWKNFFLMWMLKNNFTTLKILSKILKNHSAKLKLQLPKLKLQARSYRLIFLRHAAHA
jgi:MFS family permease